MLNTNNKQIVLNFEAKNFKDYFQKSINDLLKEGFSRPVIEEIFKILNKINQSKNGKTLVEFIKSKPLFFSIILIRLVSDKKSFIALNGQIEMANKIFDGVFELAKNVVEHSSVKMGSITIKSISEKTLKRLEENKKESDNKNKIKIEDEWKRNPNLWTSYLNHMSEQSTNETLFFLHKDKKYLDISIADAGTVGIIESAVKEWEDKEKEYFGNKPVISKLYKEDISTIKKEVQSNEDEAKLLYDMYFNRDSDNRIDLNTQTRNAYRGLGIYLFTKFINNNHGIFNVQTNKFNTSGATINFSSFSGSYQKSNFKSPEIFGTRYNIIIPIQKSTKIISKAIHSHMNNDGNSIVSKGVYEKMLPLEKSTKIDAYSLAGLNSYHLYRYLIKNNFDSNNETFVFSLKTKYNKSTLLPIDRTKVFRAICDLFEINNSLKSVIIKDASEELITGLFEIYTDFILPNNDTNNSLKDKLILLIANKEQEKSVINGRKVAIIAGNSIEYCKKINQHISVKNNSINAFPEMCIDVSIEEQSEIEDILDKHNLFCKAQLITLDFFEYGYPYFEDKAKKKLEKTIENEGYKWEGTHLKIGSKLHLDDFVYGKKMFQQSKEVSAFAFNLSREIFYKTINKENNKKEIVYTIIGYGYYSELLVSQTRDFLEWLCRKANLSNIPQIEYTIIKDDDEIEFSRYIHNLELRDREANEWHKEHFITYQRELETLKSQYEESDKKWKERYIESSEKDKFITQRKEQKIQYQKNIENVNRKYNHKQYTEEKLIIVVPISSTLTTCLKIENAFHSTLENKANDKEKKDILKQLEYNNKRFTVLQPFYTIIVVGDEVELPKLQKDLRKYAVVKKRWKRITNNQIITHNREQDRDRSNQFNIYIKSRWRQPDNCEHCFPKNPIQERPLFITDKVSVTPTLAFDATEWYPLPDSKYKPYFRFKNDSTITKYPIIDTINWVHYKGDNNKHFNYYLHYLDFLTANKEILENWAKEIKDNFTKEDNVLLIVPDKAENGEFINTINREIFDNRANIIRFDRYSDHYLNFKKFFGNDIRDAKAIYFVDNLMISGKNFLLLDSILKLLNITTERFKGIFCLINRMNYDCYINIVDCLKLNNNSLSTRHGYENYLHSFINLYAPESTIIPCPLCEEEKKYNELINNASLDCIKQYFVERELPYYKKTTKKDLTENNLPDLPLEKHNNSTLLKVTFIHFLNKAFAEDGDFIEPLKTTALPDWGNTDNYEIYLKFNYFTECFRKYINEQDQCNISIDVINELKFKANLIKVLSSQPLKKHRGVYISVFYWVLNELAVFACTILKKRLYKGVIRQTKFDILLNPCRDFDTYIDMVNYLRMLVKYASSLNIAYLLHSDFIEALNKFINNTDTGKEVILKKYRRLNENKRKALYKKYKVMRYSFDNFKLFCAAHIIRSLYKNEQRAIKFEQNLNNILKKEIIDKKDISFLELLILENTSIIRKTLDSIKPRNRKKEQFSSKEELLLEDYTEFTKNTNFCNDKDTLLKTVILRSTLDKQKEEKIKIEKEDVTRKEAETIIKTFLLLLDFLLKIKKMEVAYYYINIRT